MSERKLALGDMVCQTDVAVPTILVEPFNNEEGGEPEVFVQWYGDSEFANLEGMQFRFTVPCPPKSPRWMGSPELFKVIFIGQVKEWPYHTVREYIADCYTDGNQEGWVIWLTSFHSSTESSGVIVPSCLVIPMTTVLADESGVVINPQKFCNLMVLEEARQKVAQFLPAGAN